MFAIRGEQQAGVSKRYLIDRSVRQLSGTFPSFSTGSLTPRFLLRTNWRVCEPPAVTTVNMAPNYGLFYGVEITTLCVAVICFSLRLSNRSIKNVISFVCPTKVQATKHLHVSTAPHPLFKINLQQPELPPLTSLKGRLRTAHGGMLLRLHDRHGVAAILPGLWHGL